MLKPFTVRKQIQFSEEEWALVFGAAKKAGLDPVRFIKAAALAVGKEGRKA